MLPDVPDEETFEALRSRTEFWLPAIRHLADVHGLSGEPEPLLEGSCVLFAVGDVVIKLFEPWYRAHADTEAASLRWLEGKLPVPTPRLVARSELEGWAVIVMSRLPGQTLASAALDGPALCSVLSQLGEVGRRLHGLPEAKAALPNQWSAFVSSQRAGALDRHRTLGASEELLAEIAAVLDETQLGRDLPVFVHTELTDTNVLVEERAGRFELSGIVDFEPSMLAHPEYDLPSFTIFAARGDREASLAALRGYGVEPTSELRRRLLVYTLLHRYSHLPFFGSRVGLVGERSLAEYERAFFPW